MKEFDRLDPRPEYARPWQERGVCHGDDNALFFGPESERKGARLRRELRAKAMCRTCPVMIQCRDHALRVDEPCGIWGGLTEEERALVQAKLGGMNLLPR